MRGMVFNIDKTVKQMKFNSNYYRGLEGRGAYKSFMGKVAHLPQHAGAWGIWGNF